MLYGLSVLGGVAVLIWRCKDEWRQLPNRGFFLVLAAAWTLLFVFLGNAKFGLLDPSSIYFWVYVIDTAPLADEGHGSWYLSWFWPSIGGNGRNCWLGRRSFGGRHWG